jgi:hypothetical protein
LTPPSKLLGVFGASPICKFGADDTRESFLKATAKCRSVGCRQCPVGPRTVLSIHVYPAAASCDSSSVFSIRDVMSPNLQPASR